MALNKTDLAFKKLINKEFTNPGREFFQELTISTLDLNSTEVYTGAIGATTASVIDAGIGRKLEQFTLTPDLAYPTSAFHLQSGSGFTPGTSVYTAGFTQRNFLSDKYGAEYEVKLYASNDTQIFKTDAINWIFDYKSGILHVADPGAYTTPYKVTVVQYTGPTLSGSLAEVSSSIANISTNQISSGSTSVKTTPNSITTVVNGTSSSFANGTSVTFYTPVTGSFSGSFSGDGSGLTGIVASGGSSLEFALSSGEGIEDFIYNASEPITVAVSGAAQLTDNAITKWNDTDGKFVTSSLSDNGTVISGNTSIQLTGASSKLSGSFSGSFEGDGSALLGIAATLAVSGSTGSGTVDLKTQALTIQGTANEITTSFSGQTLTVGLPTNVVITGDLTVNGTTTTINTANLIIEDRFALFASGSTTATDGGIIIQSNSAGTGFALGYSTTRARWSLESNLTGSAIAFSPTPTAYVGTVEVGIVSPMLAPAYGGSSNGDGTMFIDTVAHDIWIYA